MKFILPAVWLAFVYLFGAVVAGDWNWVEMFWNMPGGGLGRFIVMTIVSFVACGAFGLGLVIDET